MNRVEVMNSVSLKKKFCRDCNIPISVFDDPYFSERLSVLDPLFGCIDKFEDFCDGLTQFLNEQAFFECYNEVKEKLINVIKGSVNFQKFLKENFDITTTYPKKNLYTESNDGETFISIDMKKANFTALRNYSDEIFGGCETWEDFILTYTDIKHFVNSKYIRQVVFGACSPKQQTRYEKHLMIGLLDYIKQELDELEIYSLSEDEIIIHVNKPYGFSMKKLREVVANCPNGIGNDVRIEMFNLDKIAGTSGYMKTYYQFGDEDERIEFKCLDSDIYHQVAKHYYGEPITENDLVICYNGMLAKFLSEVRNPWSS